MANFHGRLNVFSNASEPSATRSDTGQDFPVDARFLYLFAGDIPGWFGDLLDME